MRRSILLLCLVLCLISLWLVWMAFQTKETKSPVSEPQIAATPSASLSPPAPPKVKEAPAARKLLKISSKGTVRLKPGESAVLGYWEIAPGMNGMAIVTPETTSEGQVKMTATLFHLSNAAVLEAEAHDVVPLFDIENYSAIGPERVVSLQRALETTRGVDMLSMPALMTGAGQRGMISIGNADDSSLSLGLRADPIAEDGGYDLSLDLERKE